MNLTAVPVLAERVALPKPRHRETLKGGLVENEMTQCEARESTQSREDTTSESIGGSRGGSQSNLILT